MSEDPKKKYAHLPLVPETTLKKRHDLDDLARKRAAANEEDPHRQRKLGRGKKAVYVVKPETFISRSRSKRNHVIRFNRVMKKGMQKRASNKPEMATKEIVDPNDENNITTIKYQSNSAGAKTCVFVIRVRDETGLPLKILHVLKNLRLNHNHDGVFVKYDDIMRKKLQCIEPWIIYGIPSKAVVADLITRRGFGTVEDQRVPLSDNVTIEKALGDEHNLICVEDLVHEVYNAGPSFEAASQFIWPFLLADSKSNFQRRTLRLKDGKEYGDQGEGIDEFIKQVL
mmetsp:Transcript_8250/g.10803  ORF Transcript_8250/g.10803 Transcript_8250/m.10803 type:complete len:284 (-) Transcript_8250:61-912(-)|eukprot:CAMPEP_0198139950 /NCGR_PEP_ID=MMETSP1443-20131203/3183_1 /TAXON_ID=186043 /ORGANISM="Entomoneis sp., Strain CCMP2396" /LENGTH=283 /DNA_ID=CAMNT_0043802233 /DNA_START=47 /DNA_END=898 /DNA_ORIENTATION=-